MNLKMMSVVVYGGRKPEYNISGCSKKSERRLPYPSQPSNQAKTKNH